eukprot:g82315.t1
MLCYAMLCYVMLCHAMLCYAMLCYAMPMPMPTLRYAMQCNAMLCNAILCYVMLFYAMLCYVMICYAMRNIIAGIDCGSFVFLGDGGVFEDHHYELKAQPDVSGDDVDIIQVDSKVPLVSALHHAHPTVTTVTLPDVVDFHHLAPHEYINMIMRNKKQQQQTSSAPLGQATIPVKKHVSFDLSPSPATEHEQQSRNSSTPPGTELEQQQSRSSSTPPGTELEQQQSRNSSTPPGTESSSTPPGTEQEQQQQVEVDNSEAHVDVHVVPGPHVDVHVVPGSLVVPGPHVDVHVVPGPHVDVHVLAGPAAPEAGQS